MSPYALLWVVLGPYWSLCVFVSSCSPYVSLWVLMGLYRSLCVPMDCNGSLWVFIGSWWDPIRPYAFQSIPMGPYGSLYNSYCVLIAFYITLCVLMDSNWSLWDTIASLA